MWGIIPAAGNGTRIQPLAFSKELLPVGSRFDGDTERPRAVSEYLIERMLQGGADKICFVISRWKFDILQYYGGEIGSDERPRSPMRCSPRRAGCATRSFAPCRSSIPPSRCWSDCPTRSGCRRTPLRACRMTGSPF